LKLLADDEIRLSFPEADGRQVYVDPGMASFFDSPALHDLQCAETMKLWAHHIPTSVKRDLREPITLPAMPIFDEEELMAELMQSNKTLSCVAGHTVVDLPEYFGEDEGEDLGDSDWPHWPKKFHFLAKAAGPYPFWQFGPDYAEGSTTVETFDVNETYEELYGGGELEVWHNSKKQATTFYHSHCVWGYIGYNKFGTSPCIAMQLGTYEKANAAKWLLFTADSLTRSSDGVFCCLSTLKAGSHGLGTINRKFVDNMKYLGNIDFHGYFYDGPAKQYAMVMNDPRTGGVAGGPKLPLEVWYETDMQGKPLRFAEVGRDKRYLDDYVLKSSDLPYLYEEMDPSSFSEDIPDNVFDIPEVCNVRNLPTCGPGKS